MPAPCCVSVLWYQINQDALIVYSLWVRVFIVCMLKSWVSYLSLYNMATGPVCALDRSVEKHIKPRELEWFMQLLFGAQKQKDTSLGLCSVLHSHSHFTVKCFPAMPSSSCRACISIALCKIRHWPKSHGKHLPPTGAEHYLSLSNPWELWVLHTRCYPSHSFHLWTAQCQTQLI